MTSTALHVRRTLYTRNALLYWRWMMKDKKDGKP